MKMKKVVFDRGDGKEAHLFTLNNKFKLIGMPAHLKNWTIDEFNGVVCMTTRDTKDVIMGWRDGEQAIFCASGGLLYENEDPKIAFAQLLWGALPNKDK